VCEKLEGGRSGEEAKSVGRRTEGVQAKRGKGAGREAGRRKEEEERGETAEEK
jgi:hypothetical protein